MFHHFHGWLRHKKVSVWFLHIAKFQAVPAPLYWSSWNLEWKVSSSKADCTLIHTNCRPYEARNQSFGYGASIAHFLLNRWGQIFHDWLHMAYTTISNCTLICTYNRSYRERNCKFDQIQNFGRRLYPPSPIRPNLVCKGKPVVYSSMPNFTVFVDCVALEGQKKTNLTIFSNLTFCDTEAKLNMCAQLQIFLYLMIAILLLNSNCLMAMAVPHPQTTIQKCNKKYLAFLSPGSMQSLPHRCTNGVKFDVEESTFCISATCHLCRVKKTQNWLLNNLNTSVCPVGILPVKIGWYITSVRILLMCPLCMSHHYSACDCIV